MRLAALEERLDALLAAGRHAELVGELEALVASQPLRERLAASCCSPSTAPGGRRTRSTPTRARATTLVEQLGVEPGPDLRRLQRGILEQDPALDAPAPRGSDLRAAAAAAGGKTLGRAAVEERVERSCASIGVVTLLGPGGVGKTRLALAVAERAAGDFPDGVAWVALEAIREPQLVLNEIAGALGNADDVAVELEGRRVLLVLDNLEQVLGCAASLAELVAATRDVRLLVTSREPLDIAAERRYQVPLLEPCRGDRTFQRPCRRGWRGARRGRAGGGGVSDRLDGLPARARVRCGADDRLLPAELLPRLDSAPDLLDGTRRDAPDRHRTLRATISWSHSLLHESGARCSSTRRLRRGLVARVGRLVSRAGPTAARPWSGRACFAPRRALWMLASIREFARERLEASGDAFEVRARHARHYLDLARVADEELTGPNHADAFARLAQEQDNIRVALTWAVALGPDARAGARCGGRLVLVRAGPVGRGDALA